MKRLTIIILIFAVFIAFIVFNLENRSDVSFGFKTFEQIPVFLTVFSSFVLGMLFALPFTISIGKNRRDLSPADPASTGKNKLMDFLTKKSGSSTEPMQGNGSPNSPDKAKKENSPYGID